MAELDTSGGGKNKGGKVRSKKQSTRVDLTAMVDLAFLLITFFMLTTTLAKPQAMDVFKPDKDDQKEDDKQELPASRTFTALLVKGGKVAWYMGLAGESAPTIESIASVRKSLLDKRKEVEAKNGNDPKKGLIVIVKPMDTSNYGNFVDFWDELNIADIKIRSIDDDPKHILDAEKEFLKKENLL